MSRNKSRRNNKNDKFKDEHFKYTAPLKALNSKQSQYIKMCKNQDVVIQTGYSGTSKTYIPTRIAIDKLLNKEIDKIILVRPQVSMSKSVGFFQGSQEEKMKMWLGQSLSIFYDTIGESKTEYLIKRGQIQQQPLETIKGNSFKDSYVIIDEQQDITSKEFQILVTRIGKGSTLVFQGDIRQCDLNNDSGLLVGIDIIKGNRKLPWGYVDFSSYDDIVRSRSQKLAVIELVKRGIF